MAALYDVLVVLDRQATVRDVQCAGTGAPLPDAGEISGWVGLPLQEIPHTAWDFSAGVMVWHEQRFDMQAFHLDSGARCVLLRRENLREQLMEAALDMIPDCIQLYDAEARIQFFNRGCKRLIELPQDESVEGQKLLEIFAVDPEYSSTLTALQTRAPVFGRYDVYKSTTGKKLATVTMSHPVIRQGRLVGGVTIERDMAVTRQVLPEYQKIQQTLARRLSDTIDRERDNRYTLHNLIGSDPQLLSAIDLASKMAIRDTNILLQGETGTGKEIFAQGIHALSSRRSEKFVAVNCAAFPETLIEGMLFGTVKGAFTGSTDKAGLIEEANHGTLFLDELNSMSLSMQAKLLRVLQEKSLQRVGSTQYIPVDIRVISSCNEDAFALSESGKLRRDLIYRLASVVVEIPPLRERLNDLEELTWYYIRQHESAASQPITDIEPAFWQRMRQHSWPGNVRELFHILDYAICDCEDGVIREKNLPRYFRSRGGKPAVPTASGPTAAPQFAFDRGLSTLVQEYERHILQEAYRSCEGNATKTAALLGISRQNFQYYMKKYKLHDAT